MIVNSIHICDRLKITIYYDSLEMKKSSVIDHPICSKGQEEEKLGCKPSINICLSCLALVDVNVD